MDAIRVRKTIDSETLHLPELRGWIGKTVEIIVMDEDEEKEAQAKLAELTPSSQELRELAAKFPPAPEWFAEEHDGPPFR